MKLEKEIYAKMAHLILPENKNIEHLILLDELTKKFVKFVCESGNEIINLNSAIKKINAKKRRIYDITNVLEGKYINIYNILCFYRDRID